MNQDCACLCGASRFRVAGNPIGRFFCHCTICQKVYGKPFADVAYFRADAVAPPVGQPVEFRATGRRRRSGAEYAGNAATPLLHS